MRLCGGLDYLLLLGGGLVDLFSWSSLLIFESLDICLHLHKLVLIFFKLAKLAVEGLGSLFLT